MRGRIIRASLVITIVGLAALFVYYFLFLHMIRVPTGSMANTIIPGDHLVVKKRAFGEISRGDLIVFKYEEDPSTNYFARVVGLPKETIEIRGKVIYVNNEELKEQRVIVKPDDLFESDYLEELSTEGVGRYRVFCLSVEGGHGSMISRDGSYGTERPFQIPGNHYFVMGDNRDNSQDSRFRGPVSREGIFGKPTMIYWSQRDRPGSEKVRWERIFARIN